MAGAITGELGSRMAASQVFGQRVGDGLVGTGAHEQGDQLPARPE